MGKEVSPISSITMTMDTLNMVIHRQGSPVGLDEVVKLVKQAIDEKKPIYIEYKQSGKKYQLMEDGNLAEIKE